MALYTARVACPRRTGKTGMNGVSPFVVEEILVDGIKAKSLSRAKKSAMNEAKRYVSYCFPKATEQAVLPDPEVVDCSRLDKKTGKPVASSFNLDATVKMKSGATTSTAVKPTYSTTPLPAVVEKKDDDKKDGFATPKTPAKTVTKVYGVALDDPFTPEILALIQE